MGNGAEAAWPDAGQRFTKGQRAAGPISLPSVLLPLVSGEAAHPSLTGRYGNLEGLSGLVLGAQGTGHLIWVI